MKAEAELPEIYDGILAFMDKNLIPSTSTGESKMLYYKMKGDYYRYLAECATGDAKGKTAEGACVAYAEATKTSEKDLVAIHPILLGMALNIPVTAQRQIPIDRTVQKTIETPQLQCIDSVVDAPVVHSSMFHRRMSRKRQLRSHSWMLSRKPLRPQRPKRFMALKPLRV